jgi:filamin
MRKIISSSLFINVKIQCQISVDGSRAGSGNLEILVNGGRVTSSVRALGGQRFVASFTPHETGIHTVQITFNGDTVPGELI